MRTDATVQRRGACDELPDNSGNRAEATPVLPATMGPVQSDGWLASGAGDRLQLIAPLGAYKAIVSNQNVNPCQ